MIEQDTWRDRNSAAPEAECRTTRMFGFIASVFRAVSRSVSPFVTLELPAQRRNLLDVARDDLLHRPGGVDDEFPLFRVEVGQPEDVPAAPFHGLFPFHGWIFPEEHGPFLRVPLDTHHDPLPSR